MNSATNDARPATSESSDSALTELPPIERGLGIACEAGGFRCAFVHGVLDSFERAGIRAEAYAATSASVLPAAFAAIGRASRPGIEYWIEALSERRLPGNGMSEMMLGGLASYGPDLEQCLFEPGASRLLVATSRVLDGPEAAGVQGELATRIGREQLLAMARGDASWARQHLESVIFDTHSPDGDNGLGPRNFRGVAYASTRMMHAWRIPAEIDGRPFVDGSYTNGCPADELLELGYSRVIAIATNRQPLYTDLYRGRRVEEVQGERTVEIIAPEFDLKELGVDFTTAEESGLRQAYDHGVQMGAGYLSRRWERGNKRDASTPELTSSPS